MNWTPLSESDEDISIDADEGEDEDSFESKFGTDNLGSTDIIINIIMIMKDYKLCI